MDNRLPIPVIEPRELETNGASPRRSGVEKLSLLWDYRRFLFRVAIWGLVLSTVVAFLIPREFTSTVRLMPPDQQSGMGAAFLAALAGKGSGMIGGLAGDVLGMKNTGDLLLGVLQSRAVEEALISKFDLRKVYHDKLWQDARKDLERRTDITQNRKSGIITVQVTDRDPRRAQVIAEEYTSQLNNVLNQVSTSAAHRERVFLEGRLKEIKQDLGDSEREFSQFSSKTGAIDIKEQGKAMVEAAALLQGQLIAAQSELEGLRQIYTANNVRVKAAEARIGELRDQIARVGGAGESVVDSGETKDSELYPSIRRLPLLGVPYADLYRRMKVDEAAFEALTQQYELAKVEEAKDIPSVKVLDPAELPEKKSFPPRLLIMFLGTTVSLFIGAIWVSCNQAWVETDLSDPRKAFARRVFHTVKMDVSAAFRNGSVRKLKPESFWSKLEKK